MDDLIINHRRCAANFALYCSVVHNQPPFVQYLVPVIRSRSTDMEMLDMNVTNGEKEH